MTDLPTLDPIEQRVLGSLLEKETATPSSYPMTLTAIRTACNQTSNREPVVDYDERTVNEALRRLRDRDLVTTTWTGSGQRSVKFAETIAPRRSWGPEQTALLTVLLLRGPQPAGALRTRTDRLHSFGDRGEVERKLAEMAAASPPLVRELPLRSGHRDTRWVHLLGPVEIDDAHAGQPSPAADSEQVLHAGPRSRDDSVRTSYDTIAAAYAENLADELDRMPFERWLLDRVGDLAGPHPIADAGCGPGHVTAYLADRGSRATGIDLSPHMVVQARERFPGGTYEVGDLRQLMRPPHSEGWGAVLAWYALIHLAGSELPEAIEALTRPLRSHGWLLLALHGGGDVVHGEKWFDLPVNLDFVQHSPDFITGLLSDVGLTNIEWYQRGPQRDEKIEPLYVVAQAN